MRRIVSCYILLTLGYSAYAQHEKGIEVLNKIRAFYEKGSAFEMSLRYDYYENGKLTESLPGEIKAKGELYYASVGQHVSINNKNCFMHVDNDNKSINIFTAQKIDYKDLIKFPVDSSLQYIENIVLDTLEGKGRVRIHFLENMKVSHSEFIYDLTNFSLNSYSLNFSNDNTPGKKLIINFLSYKTGVENGNTIFSENPYIMIKDKDHVTLTKAYQAYQVNNYLNLEK